MSLIAEQLGSGRLSFVKPDAMLAVLGVPPGHATPFAMLNESARNVQVVLDEQVPAALALNVHPLTNSASTILSGEDLLRFFYALGVQERLIRATI